MNKDENPTGNGKATSKRRKRSDVFQKLRDGTVITWGDFDEADFELHAFFCLNHLAYNTDKMIVSQVPIPLEVVFQRQPPTSEEYLDIVAHKRTMQDWETGNLPRLNPKLDLKPLGYFYALQSETKLLEFSIAQQKRVYLEALKCLRGRQAGWTLLGIRGKKALIELMARCLEAGALDWVKQTGTIISGDLLLLLARRRLLQRGKRTSGLNSRTKEQRSEAAKKGWKERKKATKTQE